MERYQGYNRHDYYFPRTLKEGFGHYAEFPQPEKTNWYNVMSFVFILASLFLVIWL